MRASVIGSLVLALGAGGLAHAQGAGQAITGDPPRLTLEVPASVPLGEQAGAEVGVLNLAGQVIVRLQRVPCSRVAGRVVFDQHMSGAYSATGFPVVPRRAIRYRVCARVRTGSGSVLRAERFLGVR